MVQPGGVGDGEPHLIDDLAIAAAIGNIHEVMRMVEQRYEEPVCHCAIVTSLLDNGADINQQFIGFSLLQATIWKNEMALFDLLLEREADPPIVDSRGYNILAYASVKRQVDACLIFLQTKTETRNPRRWKKYEQLVRTHLLHRYSTLTVRPLHWRA